VCSATAGQNKSVYGLQQLTAASATRITINIKKGNNYQTARVLQRNYLSLNHHHQLLADLLQIAHKTQTVQQKLLLTDNNNK